MRSYALFLALAVLHARAATIPAPEIEKKLPVNGALDDVSFDNNEREQELVGPANAVKDIENNLRNSIPGVVPVKIIEEQPIIKKIPLNENSNDYVPDNDDSSNIKRVEIDLKNPGPPQRQEHDSQQPLPYHSYVDRERAVAAIKQSIAESQNVFTRGIQDVTQKFEHFFANNDELTEVSKNIQLLRKNFDTEVLKLSNVINSYLKPDGTEVTKESEKEVPSGIKEVENRLNSLETNFNYGVDMLSEGVELLSILKEQDEEELKISGKADTGNAPTETGTPTGTSTGTVTGTATGTAPVNPVAGSNPTNPFGSNPVFQYLQNLGNSTTAAFNDLFSTVQNFFIPQNQNQTPGTNPTPSPAGSNPINLFQGIFPFFSPQNQTQKPPQQGTAPAGAQADEGASTDRPNILQQFQSTFQNIINPGQQQPQPNPITQFFTGVTNFFQPRPPAQQPAQQSNPPAVSQPAAASADAPAAQGTNSVPVPAQAASSTAKSEQEQSAAVQSVPVPNQPVQSEPAQSEPAQSEEAQSEPAQNEAVQIQPAVSEPVQGGPIQQIVQKGITNAVQKIKGLSNPNEPRDASGDNTVPKGHWPGAGDNGDSASGVDDIKSEPENKQPESIPEINSGEPAAEQNKTE